MAIVTTAEVKTFCQITVSTYDTLIAALIPVVQDKVINGLNNQFKVTTKYLHSATFAFVDGGDDPDTITDSNEDFVEADFTDGIHIVVEGSIDNDGFYLVGTVAAGTLTLDSGESLTAESAGESIRITKVKFPNAIKQIVSKMIYYDIQKSSLDGSGTVKSEKIGNYSVSYSVDESPGWFTGYPNSITDGLKPWRRVAF